MARILILDGHSAAALALTRSLGRAGHRIAVGANRGIFAAATLSRYCNVSFEYPISTDDADAFTVSVADFARKNQVNLVIPVTDWTTLPISRYRNRFEGICQLSLPSHHALEIVSDKYATIEMARPLGVPVPATWLVHSAEDLQGLPELCFPIVIKDRFSVRWFGNRAVFGSVSYAFSREELLRTVEQRLKVAGDVLIQSFIAGVGLGFAFLADQGEIYLPFQWQRIREVDPRGSASSSRKSIPLDPQIQELSQALIKRAGFRGIAMVEYKREPHTGRPVLMEINGRPWGSLRLPIWSGIDYPMHLVRWCLEGVTPPRQIAYKQGITCRRIVSELTHLAHLRHGKPPQWPIQYPNFWSTLLRVAVPWYPSMRYDDLSVSDPRPGLAGIANWFRGYLSRNKSRIKGEVEVIPQKMRHSA